MIKLNQWDDPEPNLDPPEEPELHCLTCDKIIESGDKYFNMTVRRIYNEAMTIVLCMDCVDHFTEEA